MTTTDFAVALPDENAGPWERTTYAFLCEKHRRSGSMRTAVGYSRMLNDAFGRIGKTPDQITSQDVFAWAYGVGLSGKQPSSVTVGARIACVSSYYRFCQRMEVLAHNPADAVQRPRVAPGVPRGLTAEEFNTLTTDARQPFLHRPLLATYPPGSIFKVVTAAAGLERGGYSTSSTFHCSPVWTGLGEAYAKNNWQTVDRGYLTIAEGLMASCNPVFYDIAVKVDQTDPGILPEFARGFGYGGPTGIEGLDEAAGLVPDAEWKEQNVGEAWYTGDAVNMGIGQGYVLVTPLQIANAYSAIAGDGTLRKPLLIKGIGQAGGTAVQERAAEVIGPLPVSSGTLSTIREGLRLVTQSSGGTSYQVFLGSSVDAAGKSGTAEDISFGANHVFFVAYANRSAPSIIALAALETGESGSREAGPMVRAILEAHAGQ